MKTTEAYATCKVSPRSRGFISLATNCGLIVKIRSITSCRRAREHGDHAGAVRLYGQALVLPVEMGDWGNTTYCLEQLAGITADEGYPGTGCEVIGRCGGAARRRRLRSGLLPHAQPRCTWGGHRHCTRVAGRAGLWGGVGRGTGDDARASRRLHALGVRHAREIGALRP